MEKRFIFIFVIFASFITACFGQYDWEDEKTTAANLGIGMGGGGAVGADCEFLVSDRFALQCGLGINLVKLEEPTMEVGINYHLKPLINSSFVSLQYAQQGFKNDKIVSLLGPMFVYRTKRPGVGIQVGAFVGMIVSKGPLYFEKGLDKNKLPALLLFNIGVYLPM